MIKSVSDVRRMNDEARLNPNLLVDFIGIVDKLLPDDKHGLLIEIENCQFFVDIYQGFEGDNSAGIVLINRMAFLWKIDWWYEPWGTHDEPEPADPYKITGPVYPVMSIYDLAEIIRGNV